MSNDTRSRSNPKKKQVNAWLDDSELAALKAKLSAKGWTFAEMVRRFIEDAPEASTPSGKAVVIYNNCTFS